MYYGVKRSSGSSGFYLFISRGQTQVVSEWPEHWEGCCCYRQREQVSYGLEGLCPGKVIDAPAFPSPDVMEQMWKRKHSLHVY